MTELNLEEYITQEAARVAADYNFYWTIAGTINVGASMRVKVKFETVGFPVLYIAIIFEAEDFRGKSKQDCYNLITAGLEEAAETLDNEEADRIVKAMVKGR